MVVRLHVSFSTSITASGSANSVENTTGIPLRPLGVSKGRPSEEEEEDFRLLLRYSDFKYPVLIDNEQMFLKLNKQIPNNKKLHTFLLNSNNDVIFIGNPLENGRIEDLFEKQIQ